jgi:hypothetical protein
MAEILIMGCANASTAAAVIALVISSSRSRGDRSTR